jgi:flagellar protein FliS
MTIAKKTLLDANLNNDVAKVDEVLAIVNEIKVGWDSIPPEQRS